jgi:thiol-disulfide isomerase/thioredoxin
MAGTPQEVTMETFESVVDSNPIVILDFWAAWCKPCQIFAPVFDEMAEAHPDVYFGKVNTEVATDLAEAFQVRSIQKRRARFRAARSSLARDAQ